MTEPSATQTTDQAKPTTAKTAARVPAAQTTNAGRQANEADAPGATTERTADVARVAAVSGGAAVAAAMDLEEAAEEAATLSDLARDHGEDDLVEGAGMLAVSQDLAHLAGQAKALSLDEVQRGMDLAGMAGQLAAVGITLHRLGLQAIAGRLGTMSGRLQTIAVDDMLRSQDAQSLVRGVAAASGQVARYGAGEVAEGMAALNTAADLQERSEWLATAGEVELEKGMWELDLAQTLAAPGPASRQEGTARPSPTTSAPHGATPSAKPLHAPAPVAGTKASRTKDVGRPAKAKP